MGLLGSSGGRVGMGLPRTASSGAREDNLMSLSAADPPTKNSATLSARLPTGLHVATVLTCAPGPQSDSSRRP